MTVSLWELRSDPVARRHDVIVLGGGVAGLSALLALQRRGVDAVALERGGVGSGASTRNAGYLMRGAADNYAAAVRDWGRDVARRLWRFSEENIEDLRALGIESLPSYSERPSCLVALEEGEEAELRRSAALMEEDGFDVDVLSDGDDAVWRHGAPRLALVNPNDAVISPRHLIDHLRAQVTLPIHEHQEVWSIERRQEYLVVRTRDSVFETGSVVCCLNAFAAALIPELRGVITPNRGQMLAIRDPRPELPFAYYANHGSEYFRGADLDTIVVGGWRKHFEQDERTTADTTTDEIQGALERFARRTIGADGPVTSRWAGTMGFSSTGLPIVAPLPSDRRVIICAGFTGHGMSLGHRAAGHAADLAVADGVAIPHDSPPPLFPLPAGFG